MSIETYVVVGASLTGAKAVEAMRSAGFEGGIVLIGDEEVRPYERPPLSKGYLRGEEGLDKVYVHDEGFYAENDIELRTGTEVIAIHPDASTVELRDGSRVSYDKLLIATGAAPRRLEVEGSYLGGIRYLFCRGLDADRHDSPGIHAQRFTPELDEALDALFGFDPLPLPSREGVLERGSA